MDYFEKAVAESLDRLWGHIDSSVNASSQVLSGRAGSSVAEDVILEAVENLIPETLKTWREEVNSTLTADGNPYRLYGLSFRPKDGNQEAHSRSIEDIIVLIEHNDEVIQAFVNIKVSNGKKSQADNSCSWKAAAYALYGTLDVTRRDAFLKISSDFSSKDHHNYFFWVLFKNSDATVLKHGHVNSLLSINPEVGLRFNINQPFPVQVIHSGEASTDHAEISTAKRRSLLHSWLTVRMADKYADLSGTVVDSLSANPSADSLSSYLALLELQKDQMKKLNDLIAEAKKLKVEEELRSAGYEVDSVVVDDDVIRAYHAGRVITVRALEEV